MEVYHHHSPKEKQTIFKEEKSEQKNQGRSFLL